MVHDFEGSMKMVYDDHDGCQAMCALAVVVAGVCLLKRGL